MVAGADRRRREGAFRQRGASLEVFEQDHRLDQMMSRSAVGQEQQDFRAQNKSAAAGAQSTSNKGVVDCAGGSAIPQANSRRRLSGADQGQVRWRKQPGGTSRGYECRGCSDRKPAGVSDLDSTYSRRRAGDRLWTPASMSWDWAPRRGWILISWQLSRPSTDSHDRNRRLCLPRPATKGGQNQQLSEDFRASAASAKYLPQPRDIPMRGGILQPGRYRRPTHRTPENTRPAGARAEPGVSMSKIIREQGFQGAKLNFYSCVTY